MGWIIFLYERYWKGGIKDYENDPEKTILEPWTEYSTNKYRGALSVRYKT